MLFLGSFPPQMHRWCMPFYYPNWINDFWRIMGLIHFADKNHFCIPDEKRFDEARIRQFCADQGLAFYDTACEVRRLRDNASDAFLEIVTPTDIKSLISGHFVDNPASGRVMEKCGFRPTGETVIDETQYQGKDRPIRVLRLELWK